MTILPAYALCHYITWREIDPLTVEGIISFQGLTAKGIFFLRLTDWWKGSKLFTAITATMGHMRIIPGWLPPENIKSAVIYVFLLCSGHYGKRLKGIMSI